jgi:lincosamide nucleotidyltransferase A/C/D/E
MDAKSVVEIVALLDEAGVSVCLDGGWGIDALLGEETRAHADLDLIVDRAEVPRLREALARAGFREKPDGTAAGFVLADARGREVDVHAIEVDARGYGSFALPDGRRWPFPPAALSARGRVGSREVRCLSADAQVQCHGQGYAPTEKDLRDMERLQERFGVVLPLALCRSAGTQPGRS